MTPLSSVDPRAGKTAAQGLISFSYRYFKHSISVLGGSWDLVNTI